MLLQESGVKIPSTSTYCPTDLPFVFTQELLDPAIGRVVKFDVLVYAPIDSIPYLEELEKCNKNGLDCRAFAVRGLTGVSDQCTYFYLTFAFQASDELRGVYVSVPGDEADTNRGTVSVPDSIGRP